MARMFFDLPDVAFTAGSTTAGSLRFSAIPSSVAGEEVYVDRVDVRVTGTVHQQAGAGGTLAAGEVAAFLSRATIEVPGLPRPLVNLRGVDLARLYKLRNRGTRATGTGTLSISSSAGNTTVEFTLPIQFSDPTARRARDFAIPARLLKDSELRLAFESLANVYGDFDTSSLTVKTTVVCHTRPEVVLPSLCTMESHDFASGTTEPQIPRSNGKVAHLILSKQRTNGSSNTGFSSSFATQVGWRVGSKQLSSDVANVAAYYNAAAEVQTASAPTNHVTGTGAFEEGIPLVVAPTGTTGAKITTDTVDATAAWRLRFDAAGSAYSLIRREVWNSSGGWLDVVRAKMNLPAGTVFKLKTASKKPLSAQSGSGLPLKATRA